MIKALNKFIESITAIGMGALVLACIWQVASRYIINKPSTVTEEFMRYGLIWVTMIASPYAYGKGKQLMISFLVKKASERMQTYIGIVVGALTVSFSIGILLIGGLKVSKNAVGQISAALQMPMQFLYYSLVVSGILMLFYAVVGIKEDVLSLSSGTSTKVDFKNLQQNK